jgi:hypothetical protein
MTKTVTFPFTYNQGNWVIIAISTILTCAGLTDAYINGLDIPWSILSISLPAGVAAAAWLIKLVESDFSFPLKFRCKSNFTSKESNE